MMHVSSLRLVQGCKVAALALWMSAGAGCGGGEDISASGFNSSLSASQGQTNVTNPELTMSTGASSTGEPGTTGEVTVTTGVDPATTTSDPTTGVDPMTTTGVDPMTTTTGVEPETTTGMMTSMTSMTSMTTGDETTDEPPPPPPPPPPQKDPQPNDGLYSHCLLPEECTAPTGCFTITDAMTMKAFDGYCTVLCNQVGDCGQKLNVPAVQECLPINAMQKVCALKCTGPADCPTGMACTALALPNMQTGNYCT